jgi:hypothetical protein
LTWINILQGRPRPRRALAQIIETSLQLRPGANIDLLVREVRLAAMYKHEGAGRIAQPDRGREVGTIRLNRCADVHADLAAPRQPLAAAQNGPCAAYGDGNNRNAGLRCGQERP